LPDEAHAKRDREAQALRELPTVKPSRLAAHPLDERDDRATGARFMRALARLQGLDLDPRLLSVRA
jgi:hypothetical protein